MTHGLTLLAFVIALDLFSSANGAETGGLMPSGPQSDGPFRKVVLDADQVVNGKARDTLRNPMELSVAQDGRVFVIERAGVLKTWNPQTKSSAVAGEIKVFDGLEDGLLGLALDPDFLSNNWLYLYYSLPQTTRDTNGQKAGENAVARFSIQNDKLDSASERILLRVPTQREDCCHSGGSLAFDARHNLYVSVGDNTNPGGDSGGYAPIDRRPGRGPFNAEKSAANANDLRGKILRIHPEADGSYSVPEGNLFRKGTPGTRPEIYAMGCRNPFRISIDKQTGFVYWGEVGPDAGGTDSKRGPAGFDEINQARAAGNFGWPYFIADNRPYLFYDFAAKTSGPPFAVAQPVNDSPYNTGCTNLPAPQPALVYYTSGTSTRFPVVNAGGGRTAMAGPVYYFDERLASPNKLPAELDRTLFIYEWSRNWIIAVKLDEHGKIAKMSRFCPDMTFKRPIDLELGPDGCLYLIENGTGWQNNADTQIVRIEFDARFNATVPRAISSGR